MKNQFVINFLVNGVDKSGTINIFEDRVILVVDKQKMNIEFSNIKGGYVDNSGMFQIVLKNDIRLSINGFDHTREIFDLFEKNRSNYHEIDFFDGESKSSVNIIPIIFKSLLFGCLAGAAVYFIPQILEEYKDVYHFDFKLEIKLWYVIVGALVITVLNTISEISKKKVTTKMGVNADDLINAVTHSMQSSEKMLDDSSTGIIVDNDYNKFCILKPPFSNYTMFSLSDILGSEIIIDNDSNNHYCHKMYIKLKLSDSGMVTNDFIPYITKKVVVNSSLYKKKLESAEKLNSYFEGIVQKYHGETAVKKTADEVRQEHVEDNKGIEMDEWNL